MTHWRVYQTDEMTKEQRDLFLPPSFTQIKGIVIVATDDEFDQEKSEYIIIGENTERNRGQAEIISRALNEAVYAKNPNAS